MPKLVVMYSNDPPTPGHLARLSGLGAQVVEARDEATALRQCVDADALLGQRFLYQALGVTKQLRWVQSTAAGVDQLFTDRLLRAAPLLCRCPIFSDVIAWHGVALAMAILRDLPRGDRTRFLPLPRKAVVVGMGMIGQELARLLRGMGVDVTGVTREHGASWREELPGADWVFLAIPGRDTNRGFFDARAMAKLPTHAVIVNLGRAVTLDHAALLEALSRGRLGGAGLDVAEDVDPTVLEGLRRLPNVMITPKVAVFTPQRQEKLERFIEEQAARFLRGDQPLHSVALPNSAA